MWKRSSSLKYELTMLKPVRPLRKLFQMWPFSYWLMNQSVCS
jgi:hypothetical protein